MTKKEQPYVSVYKPVLQEQTIHRQMGLHICEFVAGNVCTEIFHGEYRYFQFYNLAHLYAGKGILYLENGENIPMESGDAIIMIPQKVHWYSAAPQSFWSEDTICFRGDIADHFLAAGIIKAGIFHFGTTRRLLPIFHECANLSEEGQVNAARKLIDLLVDIYQERNALHTKKVSVISKLLVELHGDPKRWWTVQEMAERCSLTPEYFRRIFLKETGLKPKEYIDHLKMDLACTLLENPVFSIHEIAEKLGYLDAFHFSRRFKQLNGKSPQAYRDNLFQIKKKTAQVNV